MRVATLENNEKIIKEVQYLKTIGKNLVFTNGCFDLLHVGHLRYLGEAKKLGDVLVIGLNSDASVKRLKGDKRPIMSQEKRKELLLGLKPVDYVIIFDEDTPVSLIEKIKPQLFVKGGDYNASKIVEVPVVKSYGGEFKILPFVQDSSTTNVVETILSRYK